MRRKISFLIVSFCIDHCPQDGHGGNPFSEGLIFGPLLIFFFLGINHPPLVSSPSAYYVITLERWLIERILPEYQLPW